MHYILAMASFFRRAGTLFFLTGIVFSAYGQRFEIGANAGGAGYIGDLNQFNPLKISGLSAGAYAKINFDPYWGVGVHYNYGKITDNDKWSENEAFRDRNLNFNTTLHEIAFIGSFSFIDMYSPGSRKRFSPYLFLGIGGVMFNPKAEFNGAQVELRYLKDLQGNPYTTEGRTSPYLRYTITIPYGAGLKYKKNENWTIFGQLGYRGCFTDYLDDVSGVYPAVDAYHPDWELPDGSRLNLSDRSKELYPDKKFKPGDQRGDFRKRDTYLFVNVGISYTFVGSKCFTF